ncbi:alpha/beta fold hydrolase [Streptomyces sp. MMG1121]|uniref:alpha/beta fold hydrolase n=1 Tax=Streptomyces sp. MMG1121 TaxID=1415544 RepID=UPI000D149ABA|nr:alpha/beta fold hydrolase [Streptomyces sp. MMG1121]
MNDFWTDTAPRTSRRGHFWITGERIVQGGETYQRAPMYVEWEAPERVSRPYPVVLVHGGLLQGTEWLDTPDGRPGWAQRLVEAGYAVLVPDRPGHGRSPAHAEVVGAPPGHPFPYEDGRRVFFPLADGPRSTHGRVDGVEEHTQWPFDPADDAALDAFIAPFGPLPADLAASQELDADRLARLLDRIGPSIVVTHSASGPDGWLLADRRPDLVTAIVTVEPLGPAFATTPGIGTLDWGLTAAPIRYDPPLASAGEVREADPAGLRIPALTGLPVAVVTGGASAFAAAGPAIVEFLRTAGAAAERLHLPEHGVHGNGHGLIYELNSDAALTPVLRWLDTKLAQTADQPGQRVARVGDQVA